jgi:threonine dehydrogenase-like Zn-dependent dehydrogenase
MILWKEMRVKYTCLALRSLVVTLALLTSACTGGRAPTGAPATSAVMTGATAITAAPGATVPLAGEELFFAEVHLHGGPAPVRRFLPELIDLIWNRTIDPGKVFGLTLLLDQVAEGYRAMDERRAIKALLLP